MDVYAFRRRIGKWGNTNPGKWTIITNCASNSEITLPERQGLERKVYLSIGDTPHNSVRLRLEVRGPARKDGKQGLIKVSSRRYGQQVYSVPGELLEQALDILVEMDSFPGNYSAF